MSVKIPLSFRTRLSKDGLLSIRLLAKVSFQSRDEYLLPLTAIIDTGAPVSMIPFNVWGQCVVTRGKQLSIPSITERPECDILVTQGTITLALVDDEGNYLLKDLTIPADLCHTSELPIILGMHGFLSQGDLRMKYSTEEAWLEFPDSFLGEQA